MQSKFILTTVVVTNSGPSDVIYLMNINYIPVVYPGTLNSTARQVG
jgi:hypothetical protein